MTDIQYSKKQIESGPLSRLPRLIPEFPVLSAVERGVRSERLDDTIEDVPVADIRAAIRLGKAKDRALELRKRLAPHAKEERLHGIKSMLLRERIMRGETRFSPRDAKQVEILRKVIEREGLILAPIISKRDIDDFSGDINPTLRKLHDQLPPKIRLTLANNGSVSHHEALQQKVLGVLKNVKSLQEAEDAIEVHTKAGKPIGMGLPGFSTRFVLCDRGIKVFAGGVGKDGKKAENGADATIEWEDIANGNYTVGIAPSSFDGLKGIRRLFTNKPSASLATVVITEKDTGRKWQVTAPKGEQLAETLRTNARTLARKLFIEDEQHALIADPVDGVEVRKILKRLDNG